MKWNLHPYVIFLALVLAALGTQHLVLERAARSRPGVVNELVEGPVQKADVLVLGSSAARAGLRPDLLATELNGEVVSLAADGAAYPEQALLIDLFLARHEAKVLVLFADPWGLSPQGFSYPFHEFRYLHRLDHPVIRYHLRRSFGWFRTALWRFVPMWKYAEFNEQIGLRELLRVRFQAPVADVAEARRPPSSSTEREDEVAAKQQWAGWNEHRRRGLLRILDSARRAGLEIVLVETPIYLGDRRPTAYLEQVRQRYREIAEQFGGVYWSEESRRLSRHRRFFQDPNHLTRQGAGHFTHHLANRLESL